MRSDLFPDLDESSGTEVGRASSVFRSAPPWRGHGTAAARTMSNASKHPTPSMHGSSFPAELQCHFHYSMAVKPAFPSFSRRWRVESYPLSDSLAFTGMRYNEEKHGILALFFRPEDVAGVISNLVQRFETFRYSHRRRGHGIFSSPCFGTPGPRCGVGAECRFRDGPYRSGDQRFGDPGWRRCARRYFDRGGHRCVNISG